MPVRDDERKVIEAIYKNNKWVVREKAVDQMVGVLNTLKILYNLGAPTMDEVARELNLSHHVVRKNFWRLRDALLIRFDERRKGWVPKISD